MSSTQPGNPRRRRIAGERRGRTLSEDSRAEDSRTSAAERPVVLDKKPRRPSGSSSPASVTTRTTDEPAVTTTDTSDTSTGTEEREPRSTGWWGSRMSMIVLSVVLALLLVLTGLAAWGLLGTDGVQDINEADAVDRSMRTAPAAAEAAAAAILAYNHETLDADQDSATRFMTEEFAAEYSDTFEKVVRPAAEANNAKVTATVNASSVIRATEDTARVLLFVDQSTTSTANDGPQIALNRVVMSMVREDGSWLVEDISSY